jgi:hypothetical protein
VSIRETARVGPKPEVSGGFVGIEGGTDRVSDLPSELLESRVSLRRCDEPSEVEADDHHVVAVEMLSIFFAEDRVLLPHWGGSPPEHDSVNIGHSRSLHLGIGLRVPVFDGEEIITMREVCKKKIHAM